MPFISPSDLALMVAQISSWVVSFPSLHVRSTTDTSMVGTRKAMPVSLPWRLGMTLVTALAAPVELGMMLPEAARPPRQSLRLEESTTAWVGVILGGGRVDHLLGAAIEDGLGRLLGEEDAGGLAHVVGPKGTPPDLLGVAAARSLDLLAVEDEEVSIHLDGALGDAVDGVVLVLVGHVVGGGRPGVDGRQLHVIVLHHDPGDEAPPM